MATAIGFFIDHPEERALAGAVSRQSVRMHHDLEEMRRRYAEIIESVCGGQPISPTTVVDMASHLAGIHLRTSWRGERIRSADYLLWPSADSPRVVIPRSWRALRKVHAMGILGGGDSHSIRRVLRMPLALPVYWWRGEKAASSVSGRR